MNHSRFTAAALALALTLGAATAQAEDRGGIDDSPSPAAMGFDLLLVRPLSLVATGVGCAIFVLQIPFALMLGESPTEPAQKLVIDPARYTFTRRLGSNDDH